MYKRQFAKPHDYSFLYPQKGERGRDYFLIIDDCTVRYVSLTSRCASRAIRTDETVPW